MAEGAVKRKKGFPEGRREASPPPENKIRRTSDAVKKEKSPPVKAGGDPIIKEQASQPLM